MMLMGAACTDWVLVGVVHKKRKKDPDIQKGGSPSQEGGAGEWRSW
jgi:hypothetical protein